MVQHEPLGEAAEAVELIRQLLEFDPEHEDARRRLESWLDDNVAFPGKLYREYITGLYKDNALVRGTFAFGGRLRSGEQR